MAEPSLVQTVPGFDSAEELAQALGVTDQTIRNWVKSGMPIAGTRVVGGRHCTMYDRAACTAWVKSQPAKRKGGRRPGSGRKAETEEQAAARTQPPPPPVDRMTSAAPGQGDILEELKSAEVRVPAFRNAEELARLCNDGKMNAAQLDAAKIMLDLLKRQMEIDERNGTLVNVDDVAEAVRAANRTIDLSLQGLAGKAKVRISSVLSLTHDQAQEVQRIIASAVDEVRRNIVQELSLDDGRITIRAAG